MDKAKAAVSNNNEATIERLGFNQSVSDATLTARAKSQLLMKGNTGGMAIKLASNTSGADTVTDQLVVKSE